jgi:hypothetical protein
MELADVSATDSGYKAYELDSDDDAKPVLNSGDGGIDPREFSSGVGHRMLG